MEPVWWAPQAEEASRSPSPGALVALSVASGLVGAAVLTVVLLAGGAFDNNAPAPVVGAPNNVVEIREIVTEGTPTPASSIAKKVVPSIVTVEVGTSGNAVEFDAVASGSGVVLTDDGFIITNHHVIEDTSRARVTFQDGRVYAADVVGSDPLTDLAVLAIDANGLVPIQIGTSSDLSIGDPAIAVGNPLGLRGGASLTVGVVSAFDREVFVGSDRLFGMLQTDAPITQGSSGGALVDDKGELIGITSAIGVSSAGAEGIGFAIPVELVTRITNEIIATGDVRHAFLGVTLFDELEEQADGARVPVGTNITSFVGNPSAALGAGLQVGDRIVRFDDTVVRTLDDVIIGVRQYRVGDVVEVEVERNGERLTTLISLGDRGDL